MQVMSTDNSLIYVIKIVLFQVFFFIHCLQLLDLKNFFIVINLQ